MNKRLDIGLEIHIGLNTKSKLFSSACNDFSETPNKNTDYLDLGIPGVFPRVNEEAVKKALILAKCLNMKINPNCTFDRKHYNYFDLPLGFQITQFYSPIATGGYLMVNGRKHLITQIHLESDAGRIVHDRVNNITKLDYNRAGGALVELVTEITFNNTDEVTEFVQELLLLLEYQNLCNCNLEKGDLRVDVNMSLRDDIHAPFGKRVEIKNINSTKSIRDAVAYEILEYTKNPPTMTVTKRYDEDNKRTQFLRTKESADDYRYIPEPNIMPLNLTRDFISSTIDDLPLTLLDIRTKLSSYDVPAKIIEMLINKKSYFDIINTMIDNNKDIQSSTVKTAINIMLGSYVHIKTNSTINHLDLYKLSLYVPSKIAMNHVKVVLTDLLVNNIDIDTSIKSRGLIKITDRKYITHTLMTIIEQNSIEWKRYQNGEDKLINVFLGQIKRHNKSIDASVAINIINELKLSS